MEEGREGRKKGGGNGRGICSLVGRGFDFKDSFRIGFFDDWIRVMNRYCGDCKFSFLVKLSY